MSWKDNLRPGSFRGVEFFTDTSTLTLGRRAIQHEYPNRETPFTEDLGRIPENFELEGHVLGDDYFQAKQDLRRVFTISGPGELIHPYWGAVRVQVGTVTISESNVEGAIAKFSAKFFEAGDNLFPKGTNDKGAVLQEAIDASTSATVADLEDKFSVAGLPGFAVDSARAGVQAASDQFNKVASLGGDVAEGITNLAFSTRNLVAEVNDLLQAPDQLAARLLDSFGYLQDAFSRAEDKANALGTFFGFGDDNVVGDTPIRNQERQNQQSFNNFMRRIAAADAAGQAAAGEYASFNDALSEREEISATLEEQIKEDDGTEVFQALADVNANLVDALPDVDADLPNIKVIETETDTNTLVLTYDLFQDPTNEQDLIDRNNIRNPGSVSKGTQLEVLDV